MTRITRTHYRVRYPRSGDMHRTHFHYLSDAIECAVREQMFCAESSEIYPEQEPYEVVQFTETLIATVDNQLNVVDI